MARRTDAGTDTAPRAAQLAELFDAALAQPTAARSAWLDRTVPDARLREELRQLLEHHADRGRLDSLLERLRALRPTPITDTSQVVTRLHAVLGERYRIVREAGRGGMALVFEAEDLKHARSVAVKVLRPELSSGLGAARFLREIRIAAGLTHPHILPLHDSAEAESLLLYVAPFHPGETLRHLLTRRRTLSVDEVVRITEDVAGALQYAHAQGVVHRDIKPENILLADGRAVVSDFGIARAISAAGGAELGDAAIALGTPAYMSPEQIRGDPALDHRSDVYSLACVVLEMLTGHPPFEAPSVDAVLHGHLEQVPALRRAPRAVRAVIRRGLAKAPPARFADAAGFATALRTAVTTRVPRRWVAFGATLATTAALAVAATRSRPPVHPAASVVAVLPFAADGDTGLARVGREIVVTLSASLDGVSDLRSLDALTILAQAGAGGGAPRPLEAIARGLGATSVVQGSLTRDTLGLRAQVRLMPVGAREPLVTMDVRVRGDDLVALTDSVAWRLLAGIWRGRSPPTPNVTALTTRSLRALRAFLEGEQAALESRWAAAAAAYQRAMQADTAFRLAQWRYAYARWWYLEAVDEALIASLQRNRFALPERDRLVFESWVTDTVSVGLERARAVVTRYPEYWPGWMQYADWLFHGGPAYGQHPSEARAALERAARLNPSLIPAWEHLFLAAMPDDTVTAAQALAALQRLDFGRTTAEEFGFDIGRAYRYELQVRLGRDDPRLRDSIVVDLVLSARSRLGGGVTWPPAQVSISERVLAARPSPSLAVIHSRLLAEAWAARGNWDSAVIVADRADALHAYRLAVVGVWVRGLETTMALQRRAPAVGVATDAMGRAEVAWLDGLLAAARADTTALAAARARVQQHDTLAVPLLERTLGAFAAAVAGERSLAARTLAAANWRNPDLLVPGFSEHPFVIALSRLTAAQWLLAEGDSAAAEALLMWFEASWALDGYRPARRILAPLAMLERARIAAARDANDARTLYHRFLARYDAAGAPFHDVLAEAQEGAAR